MVKHQIKKACFLFGEGGREEVFFRFLEKTKKFENKYYENWTLEYDHASGSACTVVLEKCIRVIDDKAYDLVLCFIDTDKLKSDFPDLKKYKKEKERLEDLARENDINVMWQDKNHEDELSRASNGKIKSKKHMQRKLKEHETLIIKSDFIKKIFSYFD